MEPRKRAGCPGTKEESWAPWNQGREVGALEPRKRGGCPGTKEERWVPGNQGREVGALENKTKKRISMFVKYEVLLTKLLLLQRLQKRYMND